MNARRLTPAVTAALALLFFLCGLLFVPLYGVQTDEALFAMPLYTAVHSPNGVHLLGMDIPLMHMNYLGALKTWIYAPLFRIWSPNPYSLRLPMLGLGALTVLLFAAFLRRCAGPVAAVIGAALLATDPLFLLTTCLDWGPVAIQHACLTGACYCLLRFHYERRRRWLAAGFFLLGLGMWDKAIFAWLLIGLSAGAALLLRRQILSAWSARNAATAALAFLIGASPLIFYNVRNSGETFRSNTKLSLSELWGKWPTAVATLNGSPLFGFMVREDSGAGQPPSPTPWQRISLRIDQAAGGRRENFHIAGLAVALLLLPLIRDPYRRLALFAIPATVAGWLMMALTVGAGGAVHHVILLWPLPLMVMTAALAGLAERIGKTGVPLAASATLLLCGGNLAVTNHYLAQTVRHGAVPTWSEAIYELVPYLESLPAMRIWCADWGLFDNIFMLSEGRIRLRVGSEPFDSDQIIAGEQELLHEMASDPAGLILSYAGEQEAFPGLARRLRERLAAAGYEKQSVKVICDRWRRPVYEVFRVRKRSVGR